MTAGLHHFTWVKGDSVHHSVLSKKKDKNKKQNDTKQKQHGSTEQNLNDKASDQK